MNRKLWPDDEWERITGRDNRLFIESVLWIARTGSPWPDLLPAFGNCGTPVGAKKGFGNVCWNRSPMILIWNNFSSIAQSFEFISMGQMKKKKGLKPSLAGVVD